MGISVVIRTITTTGFFKLAELEPNNLLNQHSESDNLILAIMNLFSGNNISMSMGQRRRKDFLIGGAQSETSHRVVSNLYNNNL